MKAALHRIRVSFICCLGALATVGLTSSTASAQPEPIKVIPGRYIITRKATQSNSAGGTSQNTPYATMRSTGFFDVVVPNSVSSATVSAAKSAEELDWPTVTEHCKEIEQDPSVASCEPDILIPNSAVPNDSFFNQQWGLHDPVGDKDIDVLPAWDRGTGSKSVIVGVLDSGVHYSHPDLLPNIWINPREPLDGVDNDGNGYTDDIIGINSALNSNDPDDCAGHGTHVAGIIGAKGNNGIGVTGVNWTTSLLAVSANADCSPFMSTSGIIAGFYYFYNLKVQGHNIVVVNASFASSTFSQATYDAIARLRDVGVLVVAAAGNYRQNTASNPYYPAAYDLPNILSVAATNSRLSLASYSNYGPDVDIAAPGGEPDEEEGGIYNTYSPLATGGQSYASLAGTSMAAPMVAGAIALVASQAPQLSGPDLKELVLAAAYRVPSLDGFVVGSKFLNAAGMSELAARLNDQCPNDPNKTTPGVCGCGVADRDQDGDGKYDCQDQCPTDRAKVTPGVCGCGIADSDANGNGRIDCLDVGVGSMVPPAPSLGKQGRHLTVTMTPLQGVRYYIQLTVTPPKDSRKRKTTNYYDMDTPNVLVRGLTRGSKVQVRYAYKAVTGNQEFSYWSSFSRRTFR
jgi:subtilisin family serine protease